MQLEFDPIEENEPKKSIYDERFEQALITLNPAQREAVEHIDGPVLVVAGPGTGKTQIIAARIGSILKQTDTAPYQILCLTYTDAGTIAMRQRLLQFIGPDAHHVHIYTFHGFCNEVIQSNLEYFGKRNLEPISELEKVQLLQKLIDQQDDSNPIKRLKGDIYYEVKRLDNLFNMMKDENWSPEYVEGQVTTYLDDLPLRDEYIYKRGNSKQGIVVGDVKQHLIDKEQERMETLVAAAKLYPQYEELMKKAGRYDYSDMILWVLKAFQENEHLLRIYQEQYLYFLVDEYQDTNGAQNDILSALVAFWEIPNVFVVGDDDQSIYEFQGARVKNILDFYHAYESYAKVSVLTDNYRSTQGILDTAKAVIDNNQDRLIGKIKGLEKNLSAKGDEVKDLPSQPQIVEYPNIAHEEASIIEQIALLEEEGVNLGKVAIIYRKHAQADEIISQLEKKNIPYQTRRRINVLQEHLVANFINLLRYVAMEYRQVHSGEPMLFEILHYGFTGIPARDVARISAYLSKKRNAHWRDIMAHRKDLISIGVQEIEAVMAFEENINRWVSEIPNITLQAFLEKTVNWSGLLRYILRNRNKEWNLQVVNTFFDFVKGETKKNPSLNLQRLLLMIEQMEENNIWIPINKIIYKEEGVNFLTAHSSKGLEFEYVFMIGCTRDAWEKSRGNYFNYSLPDTLTFSNEENQLETGRRLFYVGMTRAKKHLKISYAIQDKEGRARERSLFVEEIMGGTALETTPRQLDDERITQYAFTHLQETQLPKATLLDKSYLDKLLEGYTLSVSHLNKYLSCQVAFYYENILRVPVAQNEAMAFGSSVHNALNSLFTKMKNNEGQRFPALPEFLNDFKREMANHRDSFTEQQYQRRIAYGEQLLPAYYYKYLKEWNRIVVTEYAVLNVEVAGIPIKGFLDKIEFTGKDVNVVDYKTGNPYRGKKKLNAPSDKDPNGGDYWRQLVFYKLLMDNQKRKPWRMVTGEIDFIEKEEGRNKDFEKVKLVITEEDKEIVTAQIKDSYSRIMNHEFTKGCNDPYCKWCKFVERQFDPEALDAVQVQLEF